MASRSLIIDVVVNSQNASRKLAGVAGGARQVGAAASGAMPAMSGLGRAMVGAAAGALAFQRVSGFLSASVTLFGEQEAAVTKLNAALESQGRFSEALSADYQAMASELQSLTVHGDETFLSLQALFTQVGGVGPEQMREALTAAADLSAGLGQDLNSSALLVAKAMSGNTSVLTRYGIEVEKSTDSVEQQRLVLEAISGVFRGSASAAAESFSGQVTQLGNSWGDLKEEIGAVIVPLIQQLLPAISRGIELFTGLSPQVRTAIVVVGGLTAGILALAPVVAAIALSIGALATGPIALVVAAVVGLTATWVAWGEDITRIVGQTVTSVREWLVGRLGAIFDAVGQKVDAVKGFFQGMFEAVVGGSFVPDMVDQIGVHMNRLGPVMVEPARTALDQVTGVFQGWADNLGGMMGGLFGSGGLLSGVITGGMSTIMGSLGGLVEKGLGAIGGAFKRLFGGPSAEELAGREIVENFQHNIASMLGEQQQIEAGGVRWKEVNIGVRDAYKEVGLSEQEALSDLQALYDAIKSGPSAVNPMIEAISQKMRGLQSAAEGAASAFRSLTSASAGAPSAASITVPALAEGGIVRRPTLAMVGERGPEAVIPLNRAGMAGGFSLTVNVNGGLFSDRQSIDRLATQINQATVRQMQRRRQL